MKLFKSIKTYFEKQLKNINRLLHGRPMVPVSLTSMTLDVDDVELSRSWLNQRTEWFRSKEVEQFNRDFALWNGSQSAFAFMGGRVALSACIYALDLRKGDEVILPGYTCIVVQNAFHFVGIKTIFSDVELDTFGIDAPQVESKITPKTRAIVIHHLYGLVCRDYDALLGIARSHGLKVIEDCAQATGAEYRGIKVGNRGDVAIYSTEQSKILNTIQGGIAVTNDDVLALKLKQYYDGTPYPDGTWIEKQLYNVILNYHLFKDPQRWWRGDFYKRRYSDKYLISTTEEEERGIRPAHYGRKMPAPIAALGINQLNKVDSYNDRRRKTAQVWDRWCDINGYKKPVVINGSVPVFLRYPVMVESEKKKYRDWALNDLNIELGVWFEGNLHPVQRQIKGCPNADHAVRHCINFPTLLR